MFSVQPLQHKNTYRLIKIHPILYLSLTREAGLSILTESILIGAHYAPRTHAFEKSKTFRPTSSSVTRKVRQWDSSFPGDLNASSNGSYGLLLSIMSSLNTVKTFIMTWRGLAMQMRVRCFLRSAARVVIFVKRLLRAHASAGISQQGS